MSNTIKIRRGSGVPTASDFAEYELAYDYTGNDLYVKVGTNMVKVNSEGSGTVTNVVAGNGLSGGGTVTATLDLDFSELTDMTSDISGTTEFILQNGTTESRKAASEIKLTAFDATGFSIAGTVDTSGTPAASEYARFTDNNTIEGRSYSAVRNDLGLNIGSDVLAYNADVQTIAALNPTVTEDGKVLSWNEGNEAYELVDQSSGTITSVQSMTNDYVLTASGSTTLQGESNLRFAGQYLSIQGNDPSNTYGVKEKLRIHRSGTNTDRQLQIYEMRHSGGREFLQTFNLDITTDNSSGYTYTQGSYGGSSYIEFDNAGALKFYNDSGVASGSRNAITPSLSMWISYDNDILMTGKLGIGWTSGVPNRALDVKGGIELSLDDNAIDTNNFTLRRGTGGVGHLDAPGNIRLNIDANNNQTNAFFEICANASTTPVFKVGETGIVTTGTWQGSAVGLAYGGTGATSAAGARVNLQLGDLALLDNASISDVTGLQTALDGKVPTSRTISGVGLTGTGSLASDRTFIVDYLAAIDDRDVKPNAITTSGRKQVRAYFTSLGGLTGTANNNYQDLLVLSTYSDGTGGDVNALAFDKSEQKIRHYLADQSATTWGTAKTIAYTDSTMTGTWQGTAINATYIGNLPASKITSGAFDIDRLPTAAVTNGDTDNVPTADHVYDFVTGQGYLTSSSTQSKYLRSDTADTASGALTFTNRVTISDAGADGLHLNQDTGTTTNSNRLFFTGGYGSCIMQENDDLSFRTGATVGSSSGTERFKINNNGTVTVVGSQVIGGALTANFGAVFNETANDSNFRVESVGNPHMLSIDASTNRVGIGTGSPSYTLDVSGTGRFTGHVDFDSTITIDSVLYGNQIDLTGELNFTGNGNKVIDVQTLEGNNYLLIRHHNPVGNLFENALKLTANGSAELYYNNSKKFETTNTGVTVTGNIAVTGTVDGRDIASDGSKLDGIESGATADQTKSDIDALGINATTLDGYDSSRLFRRQGASSATVGPGWMTVATNTSGRQAGEILVTDGDSGDHGFIRIHWLRSYQDSNFTVINCGGHNNRITGVRVLSQDSDNTYGEKILQVYVTANSSYDVKIFRMGDDAHYGDHTVHTPTIENTISGYSVHGQQLENLSAYGFAHEEGIQAGGNMQADRMYTSTGTVAFPAYSFEPDTNTGFYRKAADQIGFVTAGEEQMYLADGSLHIAQPVRFQFANDQRIYDDSGGGLAVGAQSHKLTLYAGSTDGTIQFKDGGRNGTVRATISGGGVYQWGSAAAHGTLTWDTGKAIVAGLSENSLELRSTNTSDMIAIENNQTRFIADGTERMRVNGNGLDLSFTSVNKIVMPAAISRDKYRVWNSSFYTIGMDASYTFGGIGSDYVMTFQMNDSNTRGFWWGDDQHPKTQGAMALTTNGKLTVAHSVRLGYGEGDTTTPGATYRLDVSGSIGATADVVAYISSDKRLKDNIQNIANPLDKLNKLNGVEFDWNDKQDLYKGHDIGVIAQEVEEVLPEIVDTREDGHKAVKYDRMVALLIEAVKEQQKQINKLEEKLNG